MSEADNTRETGEVGGVLKQFCAEVWWVVLLRGVALLILGILLITRPGLTLVVLIQFVGAYFLVDGIFAIVNSMMGRKYRPNWGWGLLMGALEFLTGLIMFANPLISTVVTTGVLVFMVAFMAILFGIVGLVTWWQIRKDVNGGWGMLAGAVLAIIAGIILLMYPKESAKVYLIIMGISALLGGLIQVFASFQIRKIGKKGLASIAD